MFKTVALKFAVLGLSLSIGFVSLVVTPTAAEIQKVALACNGKICPVFLPVLVVPAGWQLEKAASDESQMQELVV